jgi:uncharacterized protein YceK
MFKQVVYGGICIMGLSGCATFKSLDVAAHLPLYQRIFIYSGTRLDWAAIAKNDAALTKFKATPPCYPLVDLPLSFALDSIFLPLTVSAEIFH